MNEKTALTALAQDMAGRRFSCSCGKEHAVGVRRISTGSGQPQAAAASVKAALEAVRGDGVLVVMDTNTQEAWGCEISDALEAEGLAVREKCYETRAGHPLVPDERALGELLLALDADTGVLVAVGSGSINDLCKMVSTRCGIPYVSCATAPSMDGYVSAVASLVVGGLKSTFDATPPVAVHAAPEVLRSAPAELLQAGFGDVVGKIVALADWRLAAALKGEARCETVDAMVARAVVLCTGQAAGIRARDAQAVSAVYDALLLTGLAMGMAGSSRPASGAEHHLAHFWEREALKEGRPHALHGIAVGVGTHVCARVYELMGERLPEGFESPYSGRVARALTLAGCPTRPEQIGISRGLFRESLLGAMYVRPRWTILRHAAENGMLPGIADELTEEFYPI